MSTEIRIDPRLARRIEEKRQVLEQQRPLALSITAKLSADLRTHLTYHSNAIEGNTLDLGETALVITQGITIGGHTLKEHIEAINHALAYQFVQDLAQRSSELDEVSLLQLHALVMHDLHEEAAHYRTRDVSGMPPATHVPGLMDDWIAWQTGAGQDYPPLIRAALAHAMLLGIHPFVEGNGRVARLVLNLHLIRAGYPITLMLQGWRLRYIRALEHARHGRYNPIVNLVGRAVEVGLDIFLEACDAYPEEQRHPLRMVATECGINPDYLGWLLRVGRVSGVKRGGRWYVSAAAVRRYQEEVAAGSVPIGRPRRRA